MNCNQQASPSKAERVAKSLGLKSLDIKFSNEEEAGMSYLKFGKLVRPNIAEANPGIAHTKINALLGALWSDYKKQKEQGGETVTGMEKGSKASKRSRSPRGGGSATKKKAKSGKSPVTVPSVSITLLNRAHTGPGNPGKPWKIFEALEFFY